jgi:hypothetical protein
MVSLSFSLKVISKRIEHLLDGLAPPLFFLGIVGLFLSPHFISDYVKRREAEWNRRGDLTSPVTHTQGGERLGWFHITYQQSMRQNEDAPFEIAYDANRDEWRRNAPVLPSEISVSVRSVHLGIEPPPSEYVFDLDMLKDEGHDYHVWTISPKQEGDYTLIVHLAVKPNSEFVIRDAWVNGSPVPNNKNEFALPVKVFTRFDLSQASIDRLKAVGAVFSFVLTLPAIKIWLKWYLQRPRRKRAPGHSSPRKTLASSQRGRTSQQPGRRKIGEN